MFTSDIVGFAGIVVQTEQRQIIFFAVSAGTA